jgi:uncharacterized protein YkwD
MTSATQSSMSLEAADMPPPPALRSAVPILLVLVLSVLFASSFTPAWAANDPVAEEELACRVDAFRRSRGEAPHRVAEDLNRVARQHARTMADQDRLHHNPDLSNVVRDWSVLAENVGVGPSISSVHDALVASDGHRRNLLDSRMTEIGVGVERKGGRVWVVQVFRRPNGSVSGALAACNTQGSASGSTPVPAGGVPVAGDWNGDGRVTPGKFVDGTWYLSNGLSGGADLVVSFGAKGDLPVVGDWNGTGRYGLGVVRSGQWQLRQTASAGKPQLSFRYGSSSDVPLVGDWNGNGRDGVGIVRNGRWHLRQTASGGTGQIVFTYGRVTQGDVPVTGDWNRTQRSGIGVVRGDSWHLRQSPSGGSAQLSFGY